MPRHAWVVAAFAALVSSSGPPAVAEKPKTDRAWITGQLQELISKRTGYPKDMLGLDIDLEADLGIDSIKRVEILSALQERVPSLPAVQPEQLGSLHTLQDVIALLDQSGPASVAVQAEAAPARPVTPSPEIVSLSSKLGPLLLEVVAAKTGYPAEMLALEMSLDHDLGIDSIKRVEILSALQECVPALPAVQPEQLGSLQTLQDVIALLDQGQAAPATPLPLPSGRRPDLTRLSSIQRCVVRPVRIAELGGRARFDFPVGGEVVVTDLPVFREYLDKGRDALMVEPGDDEDLAEQLHRLTTDHELRSSLVSSGHEVAARFTWAACARQHRAVYEEVLGALRRT